MNTDQVAKIRNGNGFIAALDQSGGSTPKALQQYGINEEQYDSEEQMFSLVHQMRSRIMTSPSFTGERIVGTILFEKTMDDMVDNLPTSQYLWERKRIVPFLKIDKGLADEQDGVQLMKPIPELDTLLTRAKAASIFGTKMRSLIRSANPQGIAAVVEQQFDIAAQILSHGLVPIIEPEVDITISDKEEAETLLKAELLRHLATLPDNQLVMLKLSLPTQPGFYQELVDHPKVLKVVALSGGYSRETANELLAQNPEVIASFSRALSEGLSAEQTDEDFDAMLDETIESIYLASTNK